MQEAGEAHLLRRRGATRGGGAATRRPSHDDGSCYRGATRVRGSARDLPSERARPSPIERLGHCRWKTSWLGEFVALNRRRGIRSWRMEPCSSSDGRVGVGAGASTQRVVRAQANAASTRRKWGLRAPSAFPFATEGVRGFGAPGRPPQPRSAGGRQPPSERPERASWLVLNRGRRTKAVAANHRGDRSGKGSANCWTTPGTHRTTTMKHPIPAPSGSRVRIARVFAVSAAE